MNTKVLRFEFPDGSRPPMDYTLYFGDYVLVQSDLSSNPYWHDRVSANVFMSGEKSAKIIQTGNVWVYETGCYYTDEAEFMQCMKLVRGQLVKE